MQAARVYIVIMKWCIPVFVVSAAAVMSCCTGTKCGAQRKELAYVQGAHGIPQVSVLPQVEKMERADGVSMTLKLKEPKEYSVVQCREVAATVLVGAEKVQPEFGSFCACFLRLEGGCDDSATFTCSVEDKAAAAKVTGLQGKVRVLLRPWGEKVTQVPLAVGRTRRVCADGNGVKISARRVERAGKAWVVVRLQSDMPLVEVTFTAGGKKLAANRTDASEPMCYEENGMIIIRGSSSYVFSVAAAAEPINVRLRAASSALYSQIVPFRVSVK